MRRVIICVYYVLKIVIDLDLDLNQTNLLIIFLLKDMYENKIFCIKIHTKLCIFWRLKIIKIS